MTDLEKELVKKWREPNVNVRCDENDGSVSYDTSYDATRLQCADELETWLAANLERIKREACDGMLALIPSRDNKRLRTLCMMKNGTYHPLEIIPATLADEIEQRLAALEAQAKEKP